MKKCLAGLASIVFLTATGQAFAVDDATVAKNQVKANHVKKKAGGNNSRIQGLEAIVADLQVQLNNISETPGIVAEQYCNTPYGSVIGFDADGNIVCNNETENTRIVFVTRETFNGNLGGIAGADAICAQAANNSGLIGEYKAWLGDGTSDPTTTFDTSVGPYVLPDGQIVAWNWRDLTDGTILTSISIDEYGNNLLAVGYDPSSTQVWTGANYDGSSPRTDYPYDCCSWTHDEYRLCGGVGAGGNILSTNVSWATGGGNHCDALQHLYCFEQ